MMFLLDTNVISELRKVGDGRADGNVEAWAAQLVPESLHISVITLMEIEIGIRRIERRDLAQGFTLREWVDGYVMPFFEGRIIPIDAAVAMQCAELHVPDKRPERDALIEATALIHHMAVVTRNVKDFRGADVTVINPWLPAVGGETKAGADK